MEDIEQNLINQITLFNQNFERFEKKIDHLISEFKDKRNREREKR